MLSQSSINSIKRRLLVSGFLFPLGFTAAVLGAMQLITSSGNTGVSVAIMVAGLIAIAVVVFLFRQMRKA
ncbi:MAG TPA: hypothetical protein VJC15_02665 [Candidatus Paceibacterota bacterium]